MFLLVTPVELVHPEVGDQGVVPEMWGTQAQLTHDYSTLVNLDFVKRFEVVNIMTAQGPVMVTRLHGIDLDVLEAIDQISDALGQEFANASEASGPEVAKGDQRVQVRSRAAMRSQAAGVDDENG